MSLQGYYDALASHDWYYSYSESSAHYQKGDQREKYLKGLAAISDGHLDLWVAFSTRRDTMGTTPVPGRPE